MPAIEFNADSLLPKRSNLELESAVINANGRLEVVINQERLEYPVEWLRHNCQCEACFDPTSLAFKFMITEVLNMKVELKSVSQTATCVRCLFKDDHPVEFSIEWLYNRRLTHEGGKERSDHIFMHKIVPWGDPNTMMVQRCTYQKVTETSEGLETFARALVRDGLVIITGTPDREVYKEFGDKTGMLPISTHYGESFVVKSIARPISVAYHSTAIDLHTDLAYLLHNPCIQLLHCRKQAKTGGENMLADGIKAAMVLRERHPEYFELLTTLKVQHEDIISHSDQQQYYMAGAWPVISLGEDGEPRNVRTSGFSHSSFFPGTPEEYEKFAKALKEFYKILYEGMIELKTAPGDILVMDNKRLLHGRQSYVATEERELEGWYIDWDAVYSNLRISSIKNSKN